MMTRDELIDEMMDGARRYLEEADMDELLDIFTSPHMTANVGNPFIWGLTKERQARIREKVRYER